MNMQRYFVPPGTISDGHAVLSGGDFHHIFRVMRMKPGDEVLLNDVDGRSFLARIERFSADAVFLSVQKEASGNPSLNVTVAQGLIRREAMEWMVEKATEFGVSGIIPTLFSRSVVKIEDAETGRKKTERLQKIAKEAAEQCHRTAMPRIGEPVLLSALPFSQFDRIWVAYEAAGPEDGLAAALVETAPDDRILAIIGPEGGIALDELAFLRTQGARVIQLGPRILRSESACLYLLSVLSHHWGR